MIKMMNTCVIIYFVYFENKPIHIETFVWMRLFSIPDMLNPYCYKIFALFLYKAQ